VEHGSAERLHNAGEAGADLAQGAGFVEPGNEEMAELCQRNGAGRAVVGGDDRQDAQLVLVNQPQGLGAGRAQADGDGIDRHQVAHAGETSLR